MLDSQPQTSAPVQREITIRLFAGAAQLAGTSLVKIRFIESPDSDQVERSASLAEIAELLRAQHPQLGNIIACSRWAVNEQFVLPDSVVVDGAVIALIPPVSGG